MQNQICFPDIIDLPDKVILKQDAFWRRLEHQGNAWLWQDVQVTTTLTGQVTGTEMIESSDER